MRLGIDFGTTRTVVACCDRGNYPIVGFTDGAGDAIDWFPSLVAERGGELRFGLDAQDVLGDASWTVVRSFKRLLGETAASFASLEREVEIGSVRLPLSELTARFLVALREAVLTRSNLPKRVAKAKDRDTVEAVVAVPANAHGTQRFLTLDAFRRAGFEVLALLNEPSAAGFEYTHRHRETITSKREHIVVYDLGGGTFDASLVRMAGRRHEAVATAGINQLGGDDFDTVLMRTALGKRKLPAAERTRFLEQCRVAKESLNPNSRRIALDLGGTELTVAVADFYEACTPLVEKSIGAMAPVMAQLDREDGTGTEGGLAGIYVVGGGSALPVVGRLLKERFGRRVHRSPYPFAATAIGLAIAADQEAGFELTDRLSRHFGVFREAEEGRRLAFDPILTPDTPVPAPGAPAGGAQALRRVYRAAHNVGHFRFVECAAFDETGTPRGDITPFGEILFPFDATLRDRKNGDLAAVPIHRTAAGTGPLIEEQYSVDAHGMVEVRITDLDTGYAAQFRLGS